MIFYCDFGNGSEYLPLAVPSLILVSSNILIVYCTVLSPVSWPLLVGFTVLSPVSWPLLIGFTVLSPLSWPLLLGFTVLSPVSWPLPVRALLITYLHILTFYLHV